MSILERIQATEHNASYVEQAFLEMMHGEKQNVQIYLIGGIKMIGAIKSFDDYTILLSAPTYGLQLLYKHSITTISPYHG